MTFVEACRAWISTHGHLPVNVTVLFEGEEESGSPSLVPFLKKAKAELKKDIALVCDTNMWDAATPAITTRLRGLLHEEITITCASKDLHSGLYGGAAANAIHVLTSIIAGLHDNNGKVTIRGFYEGVPVLSKAIRDQWNGLKFSQTKFLAEVGLKEPAGEKGKSVLEQIWARPTAEVNGIYGGYIEEGSKTVIPAQASAKITFRLVGRQNPAKIQKAFRKHVRDRLPKGCKVSFHSEGSSSPAVEISEDNKYLKQAAAALNSEFGRPAVLMGCGGSIPVVGDFRRILGMDSLLIGFGLNDDAIHSPNEKYNVSSFRHGIRSWARVLHQLAG